MPFLIGVILLISFLIFSYLYLRKKFIHYFGSSLKEVIQEARLQDEEIPKSLASMDRLYLEQIRKDFPHLVISELEQMVEEMIFSYFLAIENKDSSSIQNEKIRTLADKKIREFGSSNAFYDHFKIHRTVISNYRKEKGIATIWFASSFEYNYQQDQESSKKIQDRAKIEVIYIIDVRKVSLKSKSLGLNCPNCGSPIRSVGEKVCSYCGTGIVDIAKRVWVINNLVFY